MYIYLTIAFFIYLLWSGIAHRKWIVYPYIISVYLLSLISAMIACWREPLKYQVMTLFPTIIFCFLLWISFSPFLQKKPELIIDKSKDFTHRFIIVGYLLSFVFLLSITALSTKVVEAFSYGLLDVRTEMYRGKDALSGYTTIEHIGHSSLRWIGGLSYSLILMFFYALAYIRGYSVLKLLLILSSLGAAYLGMLNGGRTHLMYWILFFLFSFFVFYHKIPKRSHVNWFCFMLLPIIYFIYAYFVQVSILRASAETLETEIMVNSYMGQSYPNFCRFINELDFHPYTLHRIFPLTSSLLGIYPDLASYREVIEIKSGGMDIGLFYTFMGDIYVDVGLIGLFVFVFVLFGIIGNKVCKRREISFSQLLIIGIFARILLHGLFYYSMYQRETSVSVILTLLLAYYLKPRNQHIGMAK